MKKFVKILTACAALTLLGGCAKKESEQPADQGGDTPAEVDVAVTSVSLNKHETNIYFGAKERLTATVAPENATNKLLSWSSSNEDVAVVNATGLVAALGVGDATIRVASQADPTKYDECVVHVSVEDTTVHVSSVTITEESFALDLGGTTTAHPHVTVLPENATNKTVTWSSSDPSKVVVDSSTGTIVAVAVTSEPVVVTATSVDDSTKKDTLTVTVVDTTDHDVHVNDDGVSLPETVNIDLLQTDTAIVTADVLPSNAGNKTIEWALSGEGVVEITPVGATSVSIHALSVGTVTLTGTSVDNPNAHDTCTINVTDTTTPATGVSIKINTAEVTEANIELNKNVTLDASVIPAEAQNREIVWEISSEDEQYVTLSSKTTASIIVIGKAVTSEPVILTAKAKSNPSISKSVEISVIDPTDVDRFVSFIDPENYQQYLSRVEEEHLNSVDGLSENASIDKEQFFEYAEEDAQKQVYKVGDQGEFKFALGGNVLLAGETDPDETTEVKNIETEKTLYKKNNLGVYEVVTMNNYVTVADTGVDYTFKPAAIGGEFKLEFRPDHKYYSKAAPYEFEFEVVEGYNVDSLAELSLFDNIQSKWNDYKIASGLGGVEAKGGIVLHQDIDIVSSILPSSLVESEADWDAFKAGDAAGDDKGEYTYWVEHLFNNDEDAAKARFIGSIKDCKTIFNRDTRSEDFTFEGNYNLIKCKDLKTIANLSGGFEGDGSHTSLFNINDLDMCDEAVAPTAGQVHKATFRNLAVKANGGIVTNPDNSVSEFEKGGLIAFKLDSAECYFENTIITSAFTAVMTFDDADHHLTKMEADRLIGFDSYNSVFYAHGTDYNKLSNSWVNYAGGPLVILDENASKGGDPLGRDYYEASMDCVNSYMHNYVKGTEPWFQGHAGASQMVDQYITTPGSEPDWTSPTDIQAHWYYYSAYQFAQAQPQIAAKTLAGVKDDEVKCDLVAININARAFVDNISQNLTGHFTVTNSSLNPLKNANMQMSTVARVPGENPYLDCVFPNWSTPAEAYLISSASGGNMLLNMQTGSGTANDPSHFASDYVNIFLNPSAGGVPAGPSGWIVTPEEGLGLGRYIGITLGTFPLA